MGALIAALTFLLTFRANFSYNRYWESVTAVHQMHSKWLDVGMSLGTNTVNVASAAGTGIFSSVVSLNTHIRAISTISRISPAIVDI